MTRRIMISVADDLLAQIDEAATAAGETRSGYLIAAALQRAAGDALTDLQRRRIAAALGEYVRREMLR